MVKIVSDIHMESDELFKSRQVLFLKPSICLTSCLLPSLCRGVLYALSTVRFLEKIVVNLRRLMRTKPKLLEDAAHIT